MVPDDVLFESGAGKTVRRTPLGNCEVQTLLRLATGVFYAQGVKANVLFFQRGVGGEVAATRELWICYLRTNQHFTLKANSLERPPHHPKQHGEKPRLPEPNFINSRGFQDDCFFPHLQQLQTDARAINVANFATADYRCAAQSNTPPMAQSSTSSSDMPSNSRST